MLDEIKMIESVAPDIIEVLQERYKILRISIGCSRLGVEVYRKVWGSQNESYEQKQTF